MVGGTASAAGLVVAGGGVGAAAVSVSDLQADKMINKMPTHGTNCPFI